MGWNGFFEFDGTEIINASRTEAYAAGLPWFTPVYKNSELPAMLDETYTTPDADSAPWVDPDIAESGAFYGVYPLNVVGLEDSTRTSTVTESTLDGGNPGRLRHATRSVVFSAVLIGRSECALDYGFRWLKRALIGPACAPDFSGSCYGASLRYFSCTPSYSGGGEEPFGPRVRALLSGGSATSEVDVPLLQGGDAFGAGPDLIEGGDAFGTGTFFEPPYPPPFTGPDPSPITPMDYLPPFERRLNRMLFNSGPTITRKVTLPCGDQAWTITFTGVAGVPWEFSATQPIVEGFLDPDVLDPFAPVGGGTYDAGGHAYVDTACPSPVWTPIFDPDCPALVAPPTPPPVTVGCYEPNTAWWRRNFRLSASYVPLWGDAVPVVEVTAQQEEPMRTVRIRFYPDETGTTNPDTEPCEVVGDFVLSYLPAGGTLVLDGVAEAVYVLDEDGGQRRADSLVFAQDGSPFSWPRLTCGTGYVVTVDTLTAVDQPVVDLALTSRAV